MRVALVLWIVGLLGGTAAADAVPDVTSADQALLDAIASQDVAAFARLAPRDFEVSTVWFHDPTCARQFSGVVNVAAERHAGFLHCLATLGLRVEPGPGSGARLVYEPGVQLRVHMDRGGLLSIESEWLGDPTAASVTQEELARHVIGGNPTFEPAPAVREAIEQAPGGVATVELMTCVGKAGKLESTRIAQGASPGDYVHAVEAAAAARTFAPFMAHGKPVRACAAELVTYPAALRSKAISLYSHVAQPAPVVAADDATVRAWLDALARRDIEAFAGCWRRTP